MVVGNHVFQPGTRNPGKCAYSLSPNTLCGRPISEHVMAPLNMRHAEWCPLADKPLPSTPRDPTRAVQQCDCGNQRCQESYDLGYLTGQLELVQMQRPRIVVLCGSTRFYRQFQEANYRLSLEGKIVLSLGFMPSDLDVPHWESNGITPEQKVMLDELHMRKIAIADEVFVIDVDGYSGSRNGSRNVIGLRSIMACQISRLVDSPTYVGVDPSSGEDWTVLYDASRQQRVNARAVEAGLPDLMAAVGIPTYEPERCWKASALTGCNSGVWCEWRGCR